MPDDPIFEPNTEPTGETAPVTTPADSTPATGITAQEAADLVTTGLQPVMEQINNLTQGISDYLAQNHTTAPTPTPETQDEFLTEFSQDPKASIAKIANEQTLNQFRGVVPLLSGILQQGHGIFVDKSAQDLDGTFGPGAYEKVIKPDLDRVWEIYQKHDMTKLGDGQVIARHFNEMKGIKMEELLKHREESKVSGNKQELEDAQTLMDQIQQNLTTNMSGGIRQILPSSDKPGPEVQQYLDDVEKSTGEKQPDAATWMSQTSFPSTLAGYREKIKADEAAAKKGATA